MSHFKMRIFLNRLCLILAISIITFLLFLRAIGQRNGVETPKQFKSLNKAELARVRSLETMVDDLQKQLWDAQTYEKQLVEQLKDIGVQRGGGGGDNGGENVAETNKEPGVVAGLGLGNTSDPFQDYLGCQEINRIRVAKTVGKGFTKVVQEGHLNGVSVAVKSAGQDVKDVQDCRKSGMYKKEEDCYVLASYKVLKEAMMFKQLKHPNIIRLLGLCLRSERSSPHIQERGMTVVVELGEPVVVEDIIEMPYRERIRMCIGLAQMLIYLAESPLGSVAIQDFREDQFVMVNKQIKLADVDDLTSSEGDCDSKMQCVLDKKKTNIKCATDMKCHGMNVKGNFIHASQVFFQPLIGLQIPPDYLEKSMDIVQSLRSGTMDAEELVQELLMLNVFMDENEQVIAEENEQKEQNENGKNKNDKVAYGYMVY